MPTALFLHSTCLVPVADPGDEASPCLPGAPERCGHSRRGDGVLFAPGNHRRDLVEAYPELDAVCDRLGFGWHLALKDWCKDPGWGLVELARAAQPPLPAPLGDWRFSTARALIADLIANHHRPLRHELRRLGVLVAHYHQRHPELPPEAFPAQFQRLANGISLHLDHEEAQVFPHCLDFRSGDRAITFAQEMAASGYLAFGHQEAETALNRLIHLVRAADAARHDPDLALIIDGLMAMHADLLIHMLKEEGVLLPLAMAGAR
jgi:iron-sulfur cluster repair protein YtfE (RIC family)